MIIIILLILNVCMKEYTYKEYIEHVFYVDFKQIYHKQINEGIPNNINNLSDDFSLNVEEYLFELYNVPNNSDNEEVYDDVCEDYYYWLEDYFKE